MSIAVIDYMAEEKLLNNESKRMREFIENVILRNLNGENTKVLFSITNDGAILMSQQHKKMDKKMDSGIVKQAFYIVGKYGISSKMSFSPYGDTICEFW